MDGVLIFHALVGWEFRREILRCALSTAAAMPASYHDIAD